MKTQIRKGTGYYTNEQYPTRRRVVHAVLEGKPICGTRIGKKAQCQYCANDFHIPYIECKKCLRKINKNQAK